jgi:hypothetical protein
MKILLFLIILNFVNNSLLTSNNEEIIINLNYYDDEDGGEGIIKVPLINSNNNQTLKWIIKTKIDQKITIL